MKRKHLPTGNLLDVMTDSTKYSYTPKTNHFNEVVKRTPYEAFCHFLYVFEREICFVLIAGGLSYSSIASTILVPFFVKRPEVILELIHRISI
ncbi:MAG: hypothetical protein PHW29_04470 [Flavobacterium sp.]|nr:hypothetical protein [Flavobacterium sp.]